MKKRLTCFSLSLFISLFFFGCTTQFVYKHPEIPQQRASDKVIAYKGLKDQRGSMDIDKIYTAKPVDEIDKILQEEILSTGLFKEVILISQNQASDKEYLKGKNIDLLLSADLKELKWEVPAYGRIQATSFAVGFAFGLVGGLIYGSTPTDVYGDTALIIKLTGIDSGAIYIDKEYSGHYQERMAKLKCDTPETKAAMIGNSLKICMEDFKADLISTVNTQKEAKEAALKKAEPQAIGQTKEKDDKEVQLNDKQMKDGLPSGLGLDAESSSSEQQ